MNLEHIIKTAVVMFYLLIYLCLFNDAVSNSDYTVSHWMIVNFELERVWKDMS
jgi:hypothetical protein